MPPNKKRFTKKIDEQGRLTVPEEIRKLLGVLDRRAVLEFEVSFVDFVDEQAHTDTADPGGGHTDQWGTTDGDDAQ